MGLLQQGCGSLNAYMECREMRSILYARTDFWLCGVFWLLIGQQKNIIEYVRELCIEREAYLHIWIRDLNGICLLRLSYRYGYQLLW